jgi:hypothetical protein
MSTAAAAASGNPMIVYALMMLAGVAGIGGYVFACWMWPFAACQKCKGGGKKRSPTGRAFKICRRCKGTGRRIRTGRRIFNALRVLHKEGA